MTSSIDTKQMQNDPLLRAFAVIFSVNNKVAEAQLASSMLFTKCRGYYEGTREVSFIGPASMGLHWAKTHNQKCVLLMVKEGPKGEVHIYNHWLHYGAITKDYTEYNGIWTEFPSHLRRFMPAWTRVVGIDKIVRYFTTRGKT